MKMRQAFESALGAVWVWRAANALLAATWANLSHVRVSVAPIGCSESRAAATGEGTEVRDRTLERRLAFGAALHTQCPEQRMPNANACVSERAQPVLSSAAHYLSACSVLSVQCSHR